MAISAGEGGYTCHSFRRDTGRRSVKKGRHRRFEEARAMKRSQDVDLDALFDSLRTDESGGTSLADAEADSSGGADAGEDDDDYEDDDDDR